MMFRDWRSRFPIVLALLFCAYAATMIHNSLDARRRLMISEMARVAEQNDRLAATLGNYLEEQGRFVADLATGPEIQNFLANRALGMSLRYGLRANLDDIAVRFSQIKVERRLGDRPLYRRFAFIDETGAWLVDTDGGSRSGEAGQPLRPGISIDTDRKLVRFVNQTRDYEGRSGHLVAWSDLSALADFLMPRAKGEISHALIVMPSMAGIIPSALDREGGGLKSQLARVAPGEVRHLSIPNTDQEVILTLDTVSNSALRVVGVRYVKDIAGVGGDEGFLVIAAVFPLSVFGASLLFHNMLRKKASMELALQGSQKRLLAISDNLIEGVILVGEDDRVLFCNQTALDLLGADGSPSGFIGAGLESLLSLDLPEDPSPWRRVIAQGNRFYHDDTHVTLSDGARINVALSITQLQDPKLGGTAILAFHDISAVKNAQQQLMQTARLVSIGQLAAGIAHEINTPAQYIGSNLAFLDAEVPKLLQSFGPANETGVPADDDADFLAEEVPKAITESIAGINQISKIVRSMKEFSHPGTTDHASADLNQSLENSLVVSRNSWKYVLQVECDFAEDLPAVNCLLGEINQVFLNLIVNAAQAIEDSGSPLPGSLRISTRRLDAWVEIRFTDNGPGIPASILDKIFDPFYTTKPVGKGTGQGLTICRNIINVHHGGSLTVESREGEGATFVIRLPLEPQAPTATVRAPAASA